MATTEKSEMEAYVAALWQHASVVVWVARAWKTQVQQGSALHLSKMLEINLL